MATAEAILHESLHDAVTSVRESAEVLRWRFDAGRSTTDSLWFTRAFSFTAGSVSLRVDLDETGSGATRLSLTTEQSWSLLDAGRGRGHLSRLITVLGATRL
jgi:hypothetical protein